MSNKKKVFVTGGAGYLGALLVPRLVEAGHDVHVVDIGFFGTEILDGFRKIGVHTTIYDIRYHESLPGLLEGVECVVHLAGITNDPSADLDPNLTIQVNYLATISLARRAKLEGVRSFIFPSSCSVYGAAGDALLNERSNTGPVTLYALTKLECEQGLMRLHDSDFNIACLRLATLFGCSPRMRFDLAINAMTRNALQGREIAVRGRGNQYRPFVHVRDAAEILARLVEGEFDRFGGKIVNIGCNELNFRIAELAKVIAELFPGLRIRFVSGNEDTRSYRVDFTRLGELMQGIDYTLIEDGVREVTERFAAVSDSLDDDLYYNIAVVKKIYSKPSLVPSLASLPRWEI